MIDLQRLGAAQVTAWQHSPWGWCCVELGCLERGVHENKISNHKNSNHSNSHDRKYEMP